MRFRFTAHREVTPEPPVSAKEARRLIKEGQAPEGMRVNEKLDLSGSEGLTALPLGLHVHTLDLNGCTALRALPDDPQVTFRLDLSNCTSLESLPAGLKTGTLILRNCTALHTLPEGLTASFLDISGCIGITSWPEEATVSVGRFTAANCTQIAKLPPWLKLLSQLDLHGCVSLAEIPEDLRVTGWIDLANTQIRELPPGCRDAQLRWRSARIDERIAFHPETITAEEILAEENVELRRVKLERMGYATFLEKAQAEIIDEDSDAGGPRRLLRIAMENDEDLVCVAVLCPSTGRQYVIRVPPTMESCHQAVAWIAGFDDPDAYRPLAET